MTQSYMHLIHLPLEFTQSIGDVVGNIDPLTIDWRTGIRDYGISRNYFSTLYEMPTDVTPSAKLSIIVAFQVMQGA